MDIKELRDEILTEVKALRDKYEEELKKVKGDAEKVSGEFKTFEEKINAAIDEKLEKLNKINEEIMKRQDELEKKTNRLPFNVDEKGQEITPERKAFTSFLKNGKSKMAPEEQKALSSISDPEGGYLVPEDFRNRLITKLRDAVMIRQRATVLPTTAQTVGFPTFDYDGDASWTPESGQISEENFTDLIGKTAFTPYKLARIFRVPQELAEDAMFDIEGFLLDHFARRFGEIEENVFINGDGVNKPLGLLNNPAMAIVTTAAASIAGDDIIDTVYTLKQQYRAKGAWVANRAAIKAVRKLKDTTGQYLWQPGLQAGEPQTLAGYPVSESEYFPAPVAGKPAMLFGDLSFYWIVDRTDYAVQRLLEKYAEYDQIGYKLRKRVDAAPVLGEPFVLLNMKA